MLWARNLPVSIVMAALMLLPDDAGSSLPGAGPLVGVVGGGIGGAAAALALQRGGVRVVLLERDDFFDQRRPGYGVTLQQGVSALRALGVLEEAATHDITSSSHYIFEPNGTIVGFFGRAFTSTTTTPSGPPQGPGSPAEQEPRAQGRWGAGKAVKYNIHLPRQTLRRLMMDRLAYGTVRWGCRLEDVREDEGRVSILLQGGGTVTVDVLIGADGINSQVRKCALGTPARYLGVNAIFGMSTLRHPLLQGHVFQTNDGGNRLFCMPFQEGVTFWQLSFEDSLEGVRETNASPQKLIEAALARCGRWHEPVPEMIASTELSQVSGHGVFDHEPVAPRAQCSAAESVNDGVCARRGGGGGLAGAGTRDDHCMPAEEVRQDVGGGEGALSGQALPSFGCCSRILLIGDASHAMAPFKAQGANQALLDAVSVARALTSAFAVRSDEDCEDPAGLDPSSCALCEVLRGVEAEIYKRAGGKALASRRALQMLHSRKARETTTFGFRGVQEGVISALRDRSIGAWSAAGADLDGLLNQAMACTASGG